MFLFTGGPSIVFTRYAKAHATLIKDSALCKMVRGYDANSLYLYCLSLPQPSGPYVKRHHKNGFKAQCQERYFLSFNWMDYLNAREGRKISHRLNANREKRIASFLVDGFEACSNTIFEFHGYVKPIIIELSELAPQ